MANFLAVAWGLPFDEAETRSIVQLNEVAQFYLFFKHSQLPNKFIENFKLQLHGDLSRFNEVRTLALRLSQRGQEEPATFYEEPTEARTMMATVLSRQVVVSYKLLMEDKVVINKLYLSYVS